MKILYLNHKKQQCGVYQFGLNSHWALDKFGAKFEYSYVEAESANEFWEAFKKEKFGGVLINFHPQTLGHFVNQAFITELANKGIEIFFVTGHDSTESFCNITNYIIPDPTLTPEGRTRVVGRCVRSFDKPLAIIDPSAIPKIGFFGFGFPTKGMVGLVETVNSQFDKAEIRLHVPANSFADPTGHCARNLAQDAMLKAKEGIEMTFSHDFMSQEDLTYWLSENTVNCFFYNMQPGRGVSSVIDFALASRRPLAITRSEMFRHLHSEPRLLIEENTLPQIISYGLEPTQKFYDLWQPQNLARQYEDIFSETLKYYCGNA